MRLNALFTIVFLCWLGAAAQVRSAILLSETWTGEQLYQNSVSSDPRVTFPTRTPVVHGTSLFFDTGTAFMEKLIVFELFPQHSLNPSDPVIVHITANFTRQRADHSWAWWDHDPGFGVGDGTTIVGFIAADKCSNGTAGEGVGVVYDDEDTVGRWTHGHMLFNDAGYPAIDESLQVETRFTLHEDSTEVYGAFGTKSGIHTFPTALNLEKPLSFIFIAHDDYERYQLNWVTIEVEGTAIPEPTSLLIWSVIALGGLGLAYRRRKRTA